jgi:RNA polymerase sigma-70 factor, ECF subfamily
MGAPTDADELTAILGDLPQGDSETTELNAALPALYDELRQMASSYLRKERSDHTLQPTALVHESYLRLIDQHAVDWKNRLHVLSIAARMMRRILSNYATARAANKRGEGEPKLELDAALGVYDKRAISIAAVDEALRDLENVDPRPARVVELRFFAGLTIEEIAELLDVSAPTVKREWAVAKRWLRRELSSAG